MQSCDNAKRPWCKKTETAQISHTRQKNSTRWISFSNSPWSEIAIINSKAQNIPTLKSTEPIDNINLFFLNESTLIFFGLLYERNRDHSIQQNSSWKPFGIIYMPNLSYLVHILCERFRNYISCKFNLTQAEVFHWLIVHLFHSIQNKTHC